MVTGAAAILKGARPDLSIGEIKQILVNTANTDVRQPSVAASVFPDQLAPITRIGGGEVRVDRALLAPAYVRDVTSDEVGTAFGAMSFGFIDASNVHTLTRTLRVVNKSTKAQSYRVKPNFRYQDDADTNAVSLSLSSSNISVPAGGSTDITAKLTVKGPKLRNNLMSAGDRGNAIGPLTANEYDGYIVFEASDHKLTMPWHVLPRRAAKVSSYEGYAFTPNATTGAASFKLINTGGGAAQFSSFALLGTSPDIPRGGRGEQLPNPDLRAVGVNTFLVPPRMCGTTGNGLALGVRVQSLGTTGLTGGHLPRGGHRHDRRWRRRLRRPEPRSGRADVAGGWPPGVGGAAGESPRGRSCRRRSSTSRNTPPTRATPCCAPARNQLGLTLADAGRPMRATFFATSWYFNGIDERLGPFMISPGGEEFTGSTAVSRARRAPEDAVDRAEVAAADGDHREPGTAVVHQQRFHPGTDNRGGATQETEALIFTRNP